jgi:hypothetical protein
MHIKRRGRTACLYRSRWVSKGTEGNAHGYAVQSYVGSLPEDACAIPDALAAKLTPDEQHFVERRICTPARKAAEQVRQEAERRELDPAWRLAEARRLVDEAAERSQRRRVPRELVQSIADALGRVAEFRAEDRLPHRPDFLFDALVAIRAAAAAVRDGAAGSAPGTGTRTTRVYALWAQIVAEVDGTADNSLLAALQVRGFVKRRRS